MIIPDNIAEPAIILKDQYFDLRGLSAYSAISVGSLRNYLKAGLPHFRLQGKILVKRTHFDQWLKQFFVNKTQDLNHLVDGVMNDLSGA